jgi:hypothetical protein
MLSFIGAIVIILVGVIVLVDNVFNCCADGIA